MRLTMTIAALSALLVPAAPAAPRMEAREWGRPLPLRAVALVADDGPARRRLEAALRGKGVDVVPVEPRAALADNGLLLDPAWLGHTLVLLGGIHSNRALLPLYAGYLSFGDAAYPGDDGYVVRTVTAPCGPGTAAIVVEASTPAGEAAGAARLADLLAQAPPAEFPPTLEVHLPEATQGRVRTAPDPGMRYAFGGRPEDARDGIAKLVAAMAPDSGLASYGDYGIERWVWEYNYLQDAPGVAPADVQTLDQGLLLTLTRTAGEWWRRRDGSIVGGRHQTMGTSAFAAAVLLLRRRAAPDAEAAALLAGWWSECDTYWRHAAATFHDDLEGIPSYHCPEPTLDWALRLGLREYVDRQLPLAVRRAYAVVDNLGWYAGTGTYEECRPGDLRKPVPWYWILRAAAFFHPQGHFDTLLANMPGATAAGTWGLGRHVAGVRTFAVAAAPPAAAVDDTWLGVTVVPLGPQRLGQCLQDRARAVAEGRPYLPGPPDQSFEKLCLRDSFASTGQYLVLEGYQTPLADNLPPMDANSIIRYTDLGHVWLFANTEKQGNLARSAVFGSAGGAQGPQPAGCALQAVHSGPGLGLVASHLADGAAGDWIRNLAWCRGRYLVVIDLVRQTLDGRCSLTCTFRTPQHAERTADGFRLREGAADLQLLCADAVRLSMDGGHELEGAAVPTLLRETRELSGPPGRVCAFRNLLVARDPEHQAELEFRPLGDTAALIRGSVRGEPELALVAAAPAGTGLRVGPFATDGQVLYIGSGGWAQAGGSYLTCRGTPLAAETQRRPPPEVAAALDELWAAAAPTAPRPAAVAAPTDIRPAWTFAGFAPLPQAAVAPVLTSTPPPADGPLESLLDGVVTRWATVRWPAGVAVTLTADLHASHRIARLDFRTGTTGAFNAIPDPASYPPPRPLQATFSSDGFQRDLRTRDLLATGDVTFEGLHKGSVFAVPRWTCADLDTEARQVRLTFAPEVWREGLGLSELSVRLQGPSCARILGCLLRDTDGDGTLELLAWTDQAELAVIRTDGTPAWTKALPGAITAAECLPGLATDGPRLLVTTREARLYCLHPDGREAWRTDFLDSAKLNSDLPTGYSLGALTATDGTPMAVVGNYNLATFVSPTGHVLAYERLPAAYQTMTLAHGFDWNADGVEETVSTEVWGCLSVLGGDRRRRAGGNLPRGKGIRLDYWAPPTRDQAHALVCTENGVGRLNLPTLQYAWLHTLGPILDCLAADLDGDHRLDVVVAKEDGWLLVLDEDGNLVRRELLGEPVRAVAAVRGPGPGLRLVAALPGRLVVLGAAGQEPATLAVGEYSRLLSAPEHNLLVAVGYPAAIDAYRLPTTPP